MDTPPLAVAIDLILPISEPFAVARHCAGIEGDFCFVAGLDIDELQVAGWWRTHFVRAEQMNDADFIPRPISTWPCALRVDVYDGPVGQGYTLSASFEHDGEQWAKSISVGAEDWRSNDWQLVTETDIA